jgi:hypothetical protein
MPNPPPAMTSAQYAEDLEEVKQLGAVNSAIRTADQTKVAQLWAGVNTPTNFLFVWNNVARLVSIARNSSTVEKARLFALINVALHDDAALEQLGAFVRDAPTHSNAPAAHDLMARLLLNEGRIAEGIRHLDEALKWEDYPQRAQVMRLREQAASLGR